MSLDERIEEIRKLAYTADTLTFVAAIKELLANPGDTK